VARFLRPQANGMYRLNFDALDGDMMKVSYADPVPLPLQWPMGNLPPREIYGGGAPVTKESLPTRLHISGDKRQLVDFNTAYHIYLVSRRFIDLVEESQTDLQYFPVDCIWKDGTSAGQYFFFFTTIMLDAVIREKTTATWSPTLPGKGIWQPRLNLGQTFAFDKSRLGNTQMWVDPNMPTEGALVSDALYASLRQADIESFQDTPIFQES
jgi:hypothetical protein